MKTRLTQKFLLKQNRNMVANIAFSIFILIGIACPFVPFIYSKSFSEALPSMIFMLLFTVIFFGIALKYFIPKFKERNKIKNGNYTFAKDIVTYKKMINKSGSTDDYYQIDFAEYSKKFGKTVSTTKKEYDKIHKGDEFYMVYVGDILFGYYPIKEYELSDACEE